jgi:branched-chain amino acid transport system substrate-binding protein
MAVLTFVAAACGDDEGGGGGGGQAAEKIPVSIHFQGALTGDFNYLIIPSFQGAQLKVDELNADPQFPARIALIQGDTQGDPANAPPVIEEAVSDPDTVAVIGPGFSGESEASGEDYNDVGIPFITPSATNPGLADQGWDYWYRAIANDAGQGDLAAQYLAEELGVESVFVAHDKQTYGQGLAEIVQSTLQDAGVEVVDFQGIETGADDFSAFVTTVKNSGADGLFFGGYDADFGKIVAQARGEGVDIPMMSADGSTSSTFLEVAGEAADGVRLIAPSNLAGDFISKYQGEYGGRASSVPIYAAEGYDVAGLLGEGIRSAIDGGATSPEEIREGIKSYLDGLTVDNPYQGVAKSYAFTPEHELDAADPDSLYYFYEVKGSKIVGLGSAPEVLG